MNIHKYLMALVMVLCLVTSAFSQSKKNYEEDESEYGSMATPGYISAKVSFFFGGIQSKTNIKSLNIDAKATDYYLPEVDIEVGIVDRLSLEIATGYEKVVASANLNATRIGKQRKLDATVDGLSPIFLNANIGILEENKLCPSLYMQNFFALPKTGYSKFQNEQLAYYPVLSFENTLSDVTYLDYSLSAGWDGNTPYPFYGLSINPNFDINDNVGVYTDLIGFFGKDMSPLYFADVGTTITLSEMFSIDLNLGTELGKSSGIKNAYGGLQFTFDFNAFAKK